MKKNIKKNVALLIALFILSGLFSIAAIKNNVLGNAGNSKDNFQQSIIARLDENPRPVPLYGFNGNNIRGPSFYNKAYLSQIKDLAPRLIRYPGGAFNTRWDWRTGWLVDNDISNFDRPKGYSTIPRISNGLNALHNLTDFVGCDVVFDLNMVTKNLDDQIAMLQNAQDLGINVKYVELGNEYNFQKNDGHSKFPTPELYARECENWITQIKKHFPNAKIAIIGGNKSYDNNVKNWNSIVANKAFNADAIVAHIYPIPSAVVDDDELNFQKLFTVFKNDFQRQGYLQVDSKKEIWVTEFNIQWAYVKDLDQSHKKIIQRIPLTWSQALATLLMASEAATLSANVTMALDHNIGGIPIFAAINTQDSTICKKLPNGIGMSIWLNASAKMNTMRKIAFTSNGQALNDYNVFGWKFFNTDTKKYTVVVVNLSEKNVTVNANGIINTGNTEKIFSALKNAVISTETDIQQKNEKVSSTQLEIPAYGVVSINS